MPNPLSPRVLSLHHTQLKIWSGRSGLWVIFSANSATTQIICASKELQIRWICDALTQNARRNGRRSTAQNGDT